MSLTAARVATCLALGALVAAGAEPLVARRSMAAAERAPRATRPPGATRASADSASAHSASADRADTVALRMVIGSTLHDALEASASGTLSSAARAELAWRMADVLRYRVDVSRELRTGTELAVLFLRHPGPDGMSRIGDVLAVRLAEAGAPLEVVRFDAPGERGRYLDQHGRSLRAAFLRAPLEFRRISSVFGPRLHPILGDWREHRGTDYAAATGTPVHSVAEGTVSYVGARRGYGNLVEVRHGGGIVTRYGHLRGFASRLRVGTRVEIGETIGFVGMTGLATGPHLHFETLLDGVPRDPRSTLSVGQGEPLARSERQAFQAVRAALLAMLERRASPAPGRSAD